MGEEKLKRSVSRRVVRARFDWLALSTCLFSVLRTLVPTPGEGAIP